MKLLVFGASGRTGQCILHQATSSDFVTAFERSERFLEAPRLFVGDVLDPDCIAAAMMGQDAVLCALGPEPDGPPDLCSHATRRIIEAMRAQGVDRIVAITGAMAGHPHERLGVAYRWMEALMPAAQKELLADHRQQEELLEKSGLDWTIVRPCRLTDGPLTHHYLWGEAIRIGSLASVSRADVADLMLRLVHEPHWSARAVAIAGP